MDNSKNIFCYSYHKKAISNKADKSTDVFDTTDLIYLKPKIDPEIDAILPESMWASIKLRQFTVSS